MAEVPVAKPNDDDIDQRLIWDEDSQHFHRNGVNVSIMFKNSENLF